VSVPGYNNPAVGCTWSTRWCQGAGGSTIVGGVGAIGGVSGTCVRSTPRRGIAHAADVTPSTVAPEMKLTTAMRNERFTLASLASIG
jgi:hypothetical protein